MNRTTLTVLVLMLVAAASCDSAALASFKPLPPRKVVSLDGSWQIEQGGMDAIPQAFTHSVRVPGLVDMATPAFKEVGRKSPLREAFWYRRTFSVAGLVPEIAVLKIHKAKYGTKVILNGHVVGEHLPCFTPALLDVKPYLKGEGQPNELIIRVGADRDSMPQDMPTGWDFEKYLFIPGIYDSAELILTGVPYILNVQTAPDVPAKAVRIVAEIKTGPPQPSDFEAEVEVSEAASGKVIATVKAPRMPIAIGQLTKIDVTIPLPNCRLWSPEDPFLYNVKIRTVADAAQTRFGMRSFRCDPATGRMMLNEKPYYMRGTNVCIFRFFEDAQRGELPWQADWVRKLHQKFKTMHWNSIRYCIGFPPDFWYDIADEEGFLIQDEFPIWTFHGKAHDSGTPPDAPKAEKIIPQYTEWMRERWNHPCVVIWDGQNESDTEESGQAIRAVRYFDLSNRPWENGWGVPQSPTDCVESHPYLFSRYIFPGNGPKSFSLRELANTSGVPNLNDSQKTLRVPIIINEYDWLWLNRDGSPTNMTRPIYADLLGPNSSVEQRRMLHARYVAALTEFWRGHRQAAAVLHFCGLGYSRPGDKPRPEGGATSDDFIDVRNLVFEPLFEHYVSDAFSPVGLMLDFWAEQVPTGSHREVKVVAINDLDQPWSGTVRLKIVQGDEVKSTQSQDCTLPAWGRQVLTFAIDIPKQQGRYRLAAELSIGGKAIQSLRDIAVP